MPETRWLSGEDWFKQQPEDTQLSILGRGKLDAWRDGLFDFRDLVRRTDDPTWGKGLTPRSLADLLKGGRDSGASAVEDKLNLGNVQNTSNVYSRGSGTPTGRQIDYAQMLIDDTPVSWEDIYGQRTNDLTKAEIILKSAGVKWNRRTGLSSEEQIQMARQIWQIVNEWRNIIKLSQMSKSGISQFIDEIKRGIVEAWATGVEYDPPDLRKKRPR